jgi:hypothetical protein
MTTTKRKQTRFAQPADRAYARDPELPLSRGETQEMIPRAHQFPWGIHDARAYRFEDLRKLRFSLVPRDRRSASVLQLLREEIGRVSQSADPEASWRKAETTGGGGRVV